MRTPVPGRSSIIRSSASRRWRLFTALLLVLLGLVAVRWVGELGSSPAATPSSGLDDPGRYQFYHRSGAETAQLARTDAESSNDSDAP